jgi:hypothetical protein
MSLIEFFQLRSIRAQQEETNELLEQIRRQGLGPAQRAREDQEDAERAAIARENWLQRCKRNWRSL